VHSQAAARRVKQTGEPTTCFPASRPIPRSDEQGRSGRALDPKLTSPAGGQVEIFVHTVIAPLLNANAPYGGEVALNV
jgi:hypothetical protein